jgi:hypothetical protein
MWGPRRHGAEMRQQCWQRGVVVGECNLFGNTILHIFKHMYIFSSGFNKLPLIIQSLLPPSTPAVGNRVKRPRNATSTQILHSRVRAIHRKVGRIGDIRRLWLSIFGKRHDPVLQGDSSGSVDDAAAWTVEVGVRDVAAVETGWDAEEVGVGLVLEGGVQEARVACEAEFGEGEGRAGDCIGESCSRVEDICDVVDCGIGGGGERLLDEVGEGGRGVDEWVGEEETFVKVVTDHDLQALVELAVKEELAGQGWDEITINSGSIGKLAPSRLKDCDAVGCLDS